MHCKRRKKIYIHFEKCCLLHRRLVQELLSGCLLHCVATLRSIQTLFVWPARSRLHFLPIANGNMEHFVWPTRVAFTASRENPAAVCRPPAGAPPPPPSVSPFRLVGSVTLEMRPLYGQQQRDILIHPDWTGGSEPGRWALAGCLAPALCPPTSRPEITLPPPPTDRKLLAERHNSQ